MNFRTTALLFGILLAILWVYGRDANRQKRKLDPGPVLPSLVADKTAEIEEIEIVGVKLFLFKDPKTKLWKMKLAAYSEEIRADEDRVRELISQIKAARKADDR